MYKYTSILQKKDKKNFNRYVIKRDIFSGEANEIVFKLFSDVLSKVSGSYYPPRSRKVINLIDRVKKNIQHKSTLGGCIIESNPDYVLISKEPNTKNISMQYKK